jgi:predicted O-methyltransferase YrrM
MFNLQDRQRRLRQAGAMSTIGTQAYRGLSGLPPLVQAAVTQAGKVGFELSCLPSHGRLLQLLAGGINGVIGETGTGCGVGLAWLASGARPGTRLISVDHNGDLVQAAREVFAAVPGVEIVHGDWRQLQPHGPFDLLALDGGGQGKGSDPPIEPEAWLGAGGLLVLDDFTPAATWPPMFDGRPDDARLHWLRHPRLLATEVGLSQIRPPCWRSSRAEPLRCSGSHTSGSGFTDGDRSGSRLVAGSLLKRSPRLRAHPNSRTPTGT